MADSGEADPRLTAALERWHEHPDAACRTEVLAALVTARVYASITARSTAEHTDAATGLRAESSAELALLTLIGSTGSRALPVHLTAAGAVGLQPGARPVARTGAEVCAAALADGAVAVLLEPALAAFVVDGAALPELAAGRVPVAGAPLSSRAVLGSLQEPSVVDPDMLAAAAAALQDEPVRAARLLAGPDGPVLGVVPTRPLNAAGLAALAGRVLPRLGGRQVDLAQVAATGPGVAVPLAASSQTLRRLLGRGPRRR